MRRTVLFAILPVLALLPVALTACTSPDAGPAQLSVETYLSPTGEGGTPDLEGNAVVLEFWATWCAPCIEQMPHLNALADTFADEPVVFVSVTDESEEVVRRFLQRHELRGWIGFDADRSLFEAYGVDGIPQTILIDRQGRDVAVLRPKRLTADLLADLVAGRLEPVDARRPPQPRPASDRR